MTLETFGYRIEKSRYPVAILLSHGIRLSGDLFVQAFAQSHNGPEEPTDILNSEEPFFPFGCDEGDVLLLAKEHVWEVELPRREDDEQEPLPGIYPALVELRLADDSVRRGAIFLEIHGGQRRLLDYLNVHTAPFLTLHADDGVRLVNRRIVTQVRPLD